MVHASRVNRLVLLFQRRSYLGKRYIKLGEQGRAGRPVGGRPGQAREDDLFDRFAVQVSNAARKRRLLVEAFVQRCQNIKEQHPHRVNVSFRREVTRS